MASQEGIHDACGNPWSEHYCGDGEPKCPLTWEELLAYGRERGEASGYTEDQVPDIVREHRKRHSQDRQLGVRHEIIGADIEFSVNGEVKRGRVIQYELDACTGVFLGYTVRVFDGDYGGVFERSEGVFEMGPRGVLA